LLLGRPVRALDRDGAGWQVVVGSTRDPEPVHADGVVLALPARPAGRLLEAAFPAVSAEVGAIDYASMAIVTLVLPPARLPAGSGLLIPASEGYAVKAVTYASQKWPHLVGGDAEGATVVRASVGRYGEEAVLQRDDADLAALVRKELAAVLGDLPEPRGVRVTRWGGALPQYAVGHVDRVRRARAALEDSVVGSSVALAGAAYDGVGIPACIRSGQAAADRVRAGLAERGESRHD
jgi:oxygen-dependent protoporphyrinogen oxidase